MELTKSQIELVAYLKEENAKSQAWVAEDPENRWSSGITKDPQHWADYGIFSVEQFVRYELQTALWDGYKSVHGFRPRHLNIWGEDGMSNEELKKEIDFLYERG